MRGLMIFDSPEPLEIHPVKPPEPVRQSSGPLIIAFLLVLTIVLGVLGIIFKEPLANLTSKSAIEADIHRQEQKDRRNQQILEQDVTILLTTVSERLRQLKRQVQVLDRECQFRLGVSLTQLRHHSSPRIDEVMANSDACAECFALFRNTCVSETDFADASRVITGVEEKLAQGLVQKPDQKDLAGLTDWIEFQTSALSDQRILIGQLSEYIHQSP